MKGKVLVRERNYNINLKKIVDFLAAKKQRRILLHVQEIINTLTTIGPERKGESGKHTFAKEIKNNCSGV